MYLCSVARVCIVHQIGAAVGGSGQAAVPTVRYLPTNTGCPWVFWLKAFQPDSAVGEGSLDQVGIAIYLPTPSAESFSYRNAVVAQRLGASGPCFRSRVGDRRVVFWSRRSVRRFGLSSGCL